MCRFNIMLMIPHCLCSAASSADLGLAKLLLNERYNQMCPGLSRQSMTNVHMLVMIRLCDRPQSAQSWSKFSRVFESMGDASGVRDAQSMSYVLGLGQGGHGTA